MAKNTRDTLAEMITQRQANLAMLRERIKQMLQNEAAYANALSEKIDAEGWDYVFSYEINNADRRALPHLLDRQRVLINELKSLADVQAICEAEQGGIL